jgi:hypothetical protein
MAATPGFDRNITAIVDAAQSGAAEGWRALFSTNHVAGLGVSFGTKLLYFASYTTDCPGPRPLILDRYVRASLALLGTGAPPPGHIVWRDDYIAYIDLAEAWAGNACLQEPPDVVEMALFVTGKRADGDKVRSCYEPITTRGEESDTDDDGSPDVRAGNEPR